MTSRDDPERSKSWHYYAWRSLSRKRLGKETWFQRTLN